MKTKQHPIKDREELLFLLTEAAELEHTAMCSYLYAAMSLKQSIEEGVTELELAKIEGWRKQIRVVAIQEMRHLNLVNNLLSAFGSAPHFFRANFPVPAGRFPANLEFTLTSFSESTIQHFLMIERPLGVSVLDGTAFRHLQHYHREIHEEFLSPSACDYPTVGHLYHKIANGIDTLSEKLGHDALFIGHADAQVGGSLFSLPGLFSVTDIASAHRAIESIVFEGEGAPGHSEDSHFFRFETIAQELNELKTARPDFEPARLTAVNPVLQNSYGKSGQETNITHPLAMRVVDLGNCLYTLMLRTFTQVFSPNPFQQNIRTEMAKAATKMMHILMSLADAATHLPIKKEGGDLRACIGFEIVGSITQLSHHSACEVISERAFELVSAIRLLEKEIALPGVADSLESVAQNLKILRPSE
ncbi:ferritin-like domain-containing protein [Polynucleobacter sp. AP-Melu-500A-A1]|uniref:ferritin-like domain-containing protein n=1 Tax=Polynucleobacter sp. AP-Melu-500A-A1 TaxID=2576929 RepID=UPI001C0C96F4|nr:ferritin-like domain-containing protein [Polynucleobacter sp. AP-Melu-500A-A1]MBU3630457.1 ferritin-like protein [Polynucleobacter sp. AP-Melu-500A-A1]